MTSGGFSGEGAEIREMSEKDRRSDLHDERFVVGVESGIASAMRGEFVEHEEVMARIERLLEGLARDSS